MSLTLFMPDELDLAELIEMPEAFERRRGIRVEPGACEPRFVLEHALENMHIAPRWAALLATRLYVLDGDLVVGCGGAKAAPDAHGEIEIGYGVAPSFHGCGIGTAGAQLLLDDAFARGMQRVLATTRPTNVASWRLLERLGFRRDGEMHREPDGLLWRWIIDRPGKPA